MYHSSTFSMPENDFIDIWLIDLHTLDVDQVANSLDAQEQAQAQRFKFEKDRKRFTLRRGGLRQILSHYTKTPPAHLNFVRQPNEKPTLQDCEMHFNASHSHGFALVGVSSREIGVDIEKHHGQIHDLLPSTDVFLSSAEKTDFQSISKPTLALFFRYWCLKEAFLKAIGLGFSLDPKAITLGVNEPKLKTAPSPFDQQNWQLTLLEIKQGITCAYSTQLRNVTPRLLGFD